MGKKIKRKPRPNKKEQKTLSPISYIKKYPPPNVIIQNDKIIIINSDSDSSEIILPPTFKKTTEQEIQYVEKTIRIGKHTKIVRVKKED